MGFFARRRAPPGLYVFPAFLRYTHELTGRRYYSGDDEVSAPLFARACSLTDDVLALPRIHYHAISRGVERVFYYFPAGAATATASP